MPGHGLSIWCLTGAPPSLRSDQQKLSCRVSPIGFSDQGLLQSAGPFRVPGPHGPPLFLKIKVDPQRGMVRARVRFSGHLRE